MDAAGLREATLGAESKRQSTRSGPPRPSCTRPAIFLHTYPSNRGRDSVAPPHGVETSTVPIATYCGMPLAALRGGETIHPSVGPVNEEIA
jgi:hypothetical protein